jgi:YfiH family protein
MIRPTTIVGAAFGDRHDGDARADSDARARWSSHLGIVPDWATMHQVHGAAVACADGPGPVGDADAIVTDIPGLPIVVATADCLPIVVATDHAVGVIHAGWRGITAGVIPATLAALADGYGPVDRAVIGPHIGPCCYEVGSEVASAVGFPATTTWGTTSVDLGLAAEAQLAGVPTERVDVCTHHDAAHASFRRDGTDERQVTVAWLM